MPFNGSGGFAALAAPNFPAVSGATIIASYYNNVLNDIFAGLGQVVARDGQSPWTANLPAGGFRLTGLGVGSATGDSVAFGQAAVTFGTVTATTVVGAITGHASLDLALTGGTMTGPLVVNSTVGIGTASTITGVVLNAAGGVSSNGLNVVGTGGFFNAANKFGIDNNAGQTRMYASGPNAATRGSYDFRLTDSVGTLDISAMVIDLSGNVGVGTTPASKLHMLGGEVRLQTDSVYISGYNTAGSTRRGVLQFNPADITLVAEGASSQLFFGTNGTTKLSLTADGRLFGAALHNNAGAVTGTVNQYIASGTYTPTLTNVGNLAVSANITGSWLRVGNMVTVSFGANLTATASSTATTIGISLPIASTFTTAFQLTGIAAAGASGAQSGFIQADTANSRATLQYTSLSTNVTGWFSTFIYEVR